MFGTEYVDAWAFPYSICGLKIGNGLYSSDNAANSRSSVYFNAPILQPLDGMRQFFGATKTFAQEHLSAGNLEYKLDRTFCSQDDFYVYTDILSTGTDVEHWSGENPTGVWPEYSFVSKPFRTS